MNKEVVKHEKNGSEKLKIKKAFDVVAKKDKKSGPSRRPFYWRKEGESFHPVDLRNPARH